MMLRTRSALTSIIAASSLMLLFGIGVSSSDASIAASTMRSRLGMSMAGDTVVAGAEQRTPAEQEPVADDDDEDRPAAASASAEPKKAKKATARRTARPTRRQRLLRLGFEWPVQGWISSGFGWRRSGFHHGTDIACPMGRPIRASKAGRVVFNANIPVYGKTIVIRHGAGFSTLYAHMAKTAVRTGARVGQDRVIGTCGSTGWSTGPHLHFEIRRHGRHLRPGWYLPSLR